jgi:anthranilate synthase component 2
MELLAAVHQRVPVLGVCLGHQALGEFFGAELWRAARPMHGKVSELEVAAHDDELFAELPRRIPVTRYHSLVLRELPPSLQPLAYTADAHRELMALRHRTLPLFGVQFHPEALLTTHGLAILRNWVQIVYHCTGVSSPLNTSEALIENNGIADQAAQRI